MPGITESGIKFGRVAVDKETGRTKVAQEVNGVDLGTTIDEIKKAKLAVTDLQKDKIDTNTKSIAALNEFKLKLLNLDYSVSELSNRVGWNKKAVESVLAKKSVSASTSNYATFSASSKANVGNHQLIVNQMASYDSYKTTISAPSINNALNINGTFKIGTKNPSTLKEFTITPDQTLYNANYG